MSEVAEKAAEATAEVVEESIDGVVDVLTVAKNNPVTLVVVGALGVVAGAAGGYFFAKRQLRSFYEDLATQEIAEAKEFYSNLNKVGPTGEPLTPLEVMEQRHGTEAAAEALAEYQGRQAVEKVLAEEGGLPPGEPYDEVIDEQQIEKIETQLHESRNVFKDPTFDLEEEKQYRTSDKPYIITHDEFFEAELEFDTSRVTYYELDDTLTDEHDKPITDVNGTIGDDHLVRFGSGSKDNNIVYIRNEKLQCDYEVVKSTGSYLEEVLGMEADQDRELKHSNRNAQLNRRREFRHGDG